MLLLFVKIVQRTVQAVMAQNRNNVSLAPRELAGMELNAVNAIGIVKPAQDSLKMNALFAILNIIITVMEAALKLVNGLIE